MSITRTLFFGLPALLAASLACAQPPAAAPYRSAFEGYKPFEAGDVQDWRRSNATVREIGGWRAYAREVQGKGTEQPKAAPAAAQKASDPKPADPHAGRPQ